MSIGGYIVQRPWQAVLAPGTSAAGSSRWRCGWWNAVWPGLAIGAIVVVFGTTLLGDGLGKS